MVMDPSLGELPAALSAGIRFDDFFLDQNGSKEEDPLSFLDLGGVDLPFVPPDPNPNCKSDPGVSPRGNSPEDCEIFSDISLKYISQMLLEEEDLEGQSSFYQESLALQAAEKPFYEILGGKYPLPPDQHPFLDVESPDECVGGPGYSNGSSGSSSSSSSGDGGYVCNGGKYSSSPNMLTTSDYAHFSSRSNCTGNIVDGLFESATDTVVASDLYHASLPVWQFQRSLEEASKFLPNAVNLITDLEDYEFFPQERKEESREVEVKVEKKDERDNSGNGSRGRKNPHPDDLELEGGRSNKQTAVSHEETVRSEMFDMVLLCGEGKCGAALADLQEALQNGVSKNSRNELSKGSNGGGRSRGKKQGKRELVDLRNLLIQCAQAVAANDWRTGSELLKQIRQHSSPSGDGSQRLGYYFAEGLEARLAGTGSQIYIERTNKRRTAADILKAYHLFLAACPFKRISYFFANQTILDTVDNVTRLHIVDFGINFGFQWPCFLQRLAGRSGGPPKVRMTGIDLPQSGFRPAERVEETGRRLADYARTFNIPFEYTSIACSKWETIQVEDLKIERDEVLVVNCSYQFHRLADETVAIDDSPRDLVLKTIRKMNPDVFIHGIVNGSYNSPFFITRFREALFHWSALFDMLETNVPREQPERTLIERDLFGREAMNIIACEGAERVERPETYKQWQVRTMRAGFLQLPLNQEIMKKSRDRVGSSYHKDFVIDENSKWMLLGWKGRIVYALSTWKPDHMQALDSSKASLY